MKVERSGRRQAIVQNVESIDPKDTFRVQNSLRGSVKANSIDRVVLAYPHWHVEQN
jgi:hypothetical protein